MLPSNIHVTKGSKADSHLVPIFSDLMFDDTCTWTITFMGRSWEAEILTLVWIRWNNPTTKNRMVWWKIDCKKMEWDVYLMFMGTVRTDLRTSGNVCALALSTNTNTHTKKMCKQ
jgi:hypothetical protein